jgi:hypothetical protein
MGLLLCSIKTLTSSQLMRIIPICDKMRFPFLELSHDDEQLQS